MSPVSALDLGRQLLSLPQPQLLRLFSTVSKQELVDIEAALDLAVAVRSASAEVVALEDDWRAWLRRLFPAHCEFAFAPHHEKLWEWVWSIDHRRQRPFVAAWPRGGGKSATAEMACAALGARGRRRYGLYVSATQDQADDHVSNVGALLESVTVAELYPALAERLVSKYGTSRGWRVNRLRTASGFTLDAVGLDTAARGVKMEEQRPDFLILDDLDHEHDSLTVIAKKIVTITQGLLPAGSPNLAVLAIQNVLHPDSIFARLAGVSEHAADFLAEREVSGPVPAVLDLVTAAAPGGRGFRIVSGTPAWVGQDLDTCQAQMNDWGLTAFMIEAQHDVALRKGGMFDHLDFEHCDPGEVPPLVRSVVWVDPAVTSTDSSDSQGIQADGIAGDRTIYRLFSWEQRTTPLDALTRAIAKAFELGATQVGVETDQGGDTWESVYREALAAVLVANPAWVALNPPKFVSEKAGQGHGPKAHRASQMLADYEHARGGRIVHVVGTHHTLERALSRFPKYAPLDLVDAAFWSWHDLRSGDFTLAAPMGISQTNPWSGASPDASPMGGSSWLPDPSLFGH